MPKLLASINTPEGRLQAIVGNPWLHKYRLEYLQTQAPITKPERKLLESYSSVVDNEFTATSPEELLESSSATKAPHLNYKTIERLRSIPKTPETKEIVYQLQRRAVQLLDPTPILERTQYPQETEELLNLLGEGSVGRGWRYLLGEI